MCVCIGGGEVSVGRLGGPLVQMVDHHHCSLWSDGILQTRHRVSTGGMRIGVRCVCVCVLGGGGECGKIRRALGTDGGPSSLFSVE